LKLLIAEKPDVAKKIAKSLGLGNTSRDGFIQGKDIIFTYAVGHLLELKMPGDVDETYKKWDVENLPFHFNDIPLKEKNKQYKVVKKLLNDNTVSEIINACDADREGELIFRNIIKQAKPKCKNASRMWISNTTDEGLKKAFKERRPSNDYLDLAKAAVARSYADYLIGMNATMAMTNVFAGYKNVLSVGRVQTPTLKIIVDLEKEIQDFVSEPFFKVMAKTNFQEKEYFDGQLQVRDSKENRFDNKADAEKSIQIIGTGEAKVVDVENKDKKKNPPKLYNLSDLQMDMNSRYNIGAQNVLQIAQSLYEKHSLITYPRTDENKITEELEKEVYKIVKGLPIKKDICDEIINKKYSIIKSSVAKKGKIGSHEAITPVPVTVFKEKIDRLNDIEKKVYFAIVERFLSNFFPPAEYKSQKITYERNKGNFVATAEILVKEGFLKVLEKPKNQAPEKKIFKIDIGDKVTIDELVLEEGKTQPPSRFTEGSLIRMMKNPIKYVSSKSEKDILKEVQGIGTEATRANIIEALKKRNYIMMKGKTIFPTEKGISFIGVLPSDKLKSVSLTADFEGKLEKMADGKFLFKTFMADVEILNQELIKDIKVAAKNKPKDAPQIKSGNVLTQCPNCGGDILKSKYGYFCTEKCGVSINFNALEKVFKLKKITQTQARDLLTKGKTSRKVKLHSKKKNKDFSAYLTYEFKKDEKYPNNIWIAF
jgi:DNA topoisomerase-3